MPSENSSSVVMYCASSTVIAPSLPTLVNASAMSSPMVASCAEIVATCAIECSPSTGVAIFCRAVVTAPGAQAAARAATGWLLLADREDVARGEHQVLLAGVLDLGAAVLAVEHDVADADVERDAVALVVDAAGADRDDGALLRLLLG